MAPPSDSLEMKKALIFQGLFVVKMIGYPNVFVKMSLKTPNDF
ncbi:MAG: hypothetical protein ACJAQ4_001423 [Cryomorphaceae bacterium]|jgi:hypothetical protein